MDYKIQVGFEFGPMTVIDKISGNAYDRAWILRCKCGKLHTVKRLNFNKWRHNAACSCGLKPTFKPTTFVPSPYGYVTGL